jgi:hypothetical protein
MFEQRFSALNDDDAGGMMKSPSLKRRKSVTTNSSTSVYSYGTYCWQSYSVTTTLLLLNIKDATATAALLRYQQCWAH